ncbi:MAG: hypothetical protein Ta2A_21090 [Treponemataceae bacterium]|nr:MAG: hypothetical protein Ta2A_21090 [Treponemataceae bacterium]
MEKKSVSVLCIVMFMAISASCTKKESATNSQVEPVYVFDIDSFTYFDEFPATIDGVKEKYKDVSFQERMTETSDTGHLRSLGAYRFTLASENITFTFYGNTVENMELRFVDIFSPLYQCPSIQIIGMSSTRVKDLIKPTTEFDDEKGLLRITSKDWDTIVINIENDVVVNYSVNKAL